MSGGWSVMSMLLQSACSACGSHSKCAVVFLQGQHKQTAVERLTTPTAMRMLKTLQQTQVGKQTEPSVQPAIKS